MKRKLLLFLLILFFFGMVIFLFNNLKKQEIRPMTISSPNPTSSFENSFYKNEKLGIEIKLPSGLIAEEKTDGEVVLIGDRILIYQTEKDPTVCSVNCPIITKNEEVALSEISSRRLEGYWNDTSETMAQSFVSYVVPNAHKYLVFQIQELPFSKEFLAGRKVGTIDENEVNTFESVVKTIKF